MTFKNSISYYLTEPQAWYDSIEKDGIGQSKDMRFSFNPALGEGQMEYFVFQPGLWAQQMNLTLKENLYLEQLANTTNDVFIINFYLSNARIVQKVDEKLFEFNYDNVSILLNSSMALSNYTVPANEEVKIFQIGFTREWLLSNAIGQHNLSLKKLFEQDQPIYISENLDYKFKYLLEELDLRDGNRLFLFSGTLQLLNSFFATLEERNFEDLATTNIHSTDLEYLMNVRAHMDTNPLEEISLDQLSEMANMSLSKFKRLFKQVFGSTPYKYHLKSKLKIAMEMLQKSEYSVSETGFFIGYSNLSQFAKAFKAEYGKSPSEVRS